MPPWLTKLHTAPARAVNYANCPLLTYKIFVEMVVVIYWGREEGQVIRIEIKSTSSFLRVHND